MPPFLYFLRDPPAHTTTGTVTATATGTTMVDDMLMPCIIWLGICAVVGLAYGVWLMWCARRMRKPPNENPYG